MMGEGMIGTPGSFGAMNEWDRMQLVGDLNRRRRERLQSKAAETALMAARIEAHSESDERHLEGEQ